MARLVAPLALLFMVLLCSSVESLPTKAAFEAALAPVNEGGDVWVLLVSGSSGYINYRHQADVCHAYQVVHRHGIPDSRIVTMIYDDAPRSIFNPYKGQLYNEPDGENVYDSVPKDYIGGHITPHTFIAVLTGDKNAVKKKGTGRVIESKANDRVFVYFADHGAPGFVAFPSRFHVVPTQLKAETLMKALKKMHGAGQYGQMLIYVEACESGSMFNNVLPGDISVYAVTAATPFESSWACYYNQTIGTYLGDCFSNHWLENSETFSLQTESIAMQVARVAYMTKNSTVCTYGDSTISSESVGSFLAGGIPSFSAKSASVVKPRPVDAVSSRDVALHVLKGLVARGREEGSYLEDLASHSLAQEEKARAAADEVFKKISQVLGPFPPRPENTCSGKKVQQAQSGCYEEALAAFDRGCGGFNDYSLGYAGVLLSACEKGDTNSVRMAVESACTPEAHDVMGPTALEIVDHVTFSPNHEATDLDHWATVASPAKICHAETTQDGCDAHAECTWCKCSAVPSKCFTLPESKQLPPSIFTCDKQ